MFFIPYILSTPSSSTFTAHTILVISPFFLILSFYFFGLFANTPIENIGTIATVGYDSVRGEVSLFSYLIYHHPPSSLPANLIHSLLTLSLLHLFLYLSPPMQSLLNVDLYPRLLSALFTSPTIPNFFNFLPPLFMAQLYMNFFSKAIAKVLWATIRESNIQVSHPGEARPQNKVMRKPSWHSSSSSSSSSSSGSGSGSSNSSANGKWVNLSSQESHLETERRFSHLFDRESGEEVLTGESAGRSTWKFVEAATDANADADQVHPLVDLGSASNINSSDVIFRSQQCHASDADADADADANANANNPHPHPHLHRAISFYSKLQTPSGCWLGDYGGPMFLQQGLVIAWHVMGRPSSLLTDHHVEAMVKYFLRHQQKDGGWGTHIESPSTMFGTVMTYVSLRILRPADTSR